MLSEQLVHGFSQVARSPDPDLAVAALMIARLEYPRLEAGRYLDQLDVLGLEAGRRVSNPEIRPGEAPPFVDPERHAQVMALNTYLFRDLRFGADKLGIEDPRNSFLNQVLDRRTGIPVTLALLYMEVARRAGVRVEGMNFPGRFLLRCPARRGTSDAKDLIIDAFGGAILTEEACRTLLDPYLDDDTFDSQMRRHATKPEILARVLVNLKRLYVRMHSFPQARDVTELLLAVDPTAMHELRDRGLLAYHLRDFSGALRDLQTYLLRSAVTDDEEAREEHAQIWEHVKALRRRVASLN
jgi:regulator of sirC expression with transglutaminase-like and TPR domain